MPQDELYDVLIVGAGAAAFGAALYAARYRMKTLVIGEQFGGDTGIAGVIENYPGLGHIDGFDLMMKMREQVEALGVESVDDRVDQIEKTDACFSAKVADVSYQGKTVIIAVGRERRKLMLPKEEELTGKGVSYCSVCDAPLSKGQLVAVVGGGDAAVKGALLVAQYAKHVYIIYRGDRFSRAEPINVHELERSPNVDIILGTNVVGIRGDNVVEGLTLDRAFQGTKDLTVGRVFVEIGADPRTALAQALGVKLNSKKEIAVDKLMRTNVRGVFAAGDVTDGAGDLKQTITATAQGVIAATSAYKCVTSHPHSCDLHAMACGAE